MKYKIIILLFFVSVLLVSISFVFANNSDINSDNTKNINENPVIGDNLSLNNSQTTVPQKTFTAKGKTIGYSVEGYQPLKYSKKAKKQLNKVKIKNKKVKTKYSVTLSDAQYNKLLSAKKQGKLKEIQVKTNKYVKIKKPVVKKEKKTIFNRKYYSMSKFDKAWSNFDEKYGYDDNYKIKVKPHYRRYNDDRGVGSEVVYYKLSIIKKYNKIKYFKTKKARISASITVNDGQSFADGKKGDIVKFYVPQFGIDETMAYARINIQ